MLRGKFGVAVQKGLPRAVEFFISAPSTDPFLESIDVAETEDVRDMNAGPVHKRRVPQGLRELLVLRIRKDTPPELEEKILKAAEPKLREIKKKYS